MNQPEPDKESPESKEKPFNEVPVETENAGETPAPETPTPPKKIESKFQHFGFLIVFLLGALTMEFVFYRPLAGQLDQVKGERDQAQQTVKNLQGQLDSLAPLSNQNKTLQDQLSKSELHVTILSAEANVSSAQLSLMNNKPADARLVLDKTSTTLKTLQGMLPPDQQKVISDMQSRLNLALSELDNNKFAAQSDLNVLATSLVQLENTFFANP
jgi:hypothetical protein